MDEITKTETDTTPLQKAINERGYIVLCAWGKYANINHKNGDQVLVAIDQMPVSQPFFVICETDRQDFIEHRKAAGWIEELPLPIFKTRYWRAGTD